VVELIGSALQQLSYRSIEQFIVDNDLAQKPLFIALSGGVDSVVLLHMFYQLRQNAGLDFQAIHVNHGLSKNAETWQQKVTDMCQEWQIPLIVKSVNLIKKNRQSLEQVARDARYQVVAESLPAGAVIFTGHHQADQFETFILRLMRSSGLTGLSAMKSVSDIPNSLGKANSIGLARPLLAAPKEQILEYAKNTKLSWVEDESNQDEKFDRNFIRNSLLPKFLKRWPQATQSVAQSVELLQQEQDLLLEYLKQDLANCTVSCFAELKGLDLTKLAEFSKNKQSALIRQFVFEQAGAYPSRSAIVEITDNLMQANQDTKPELMLNKDLRLYIHDKKLMTKPALVNDIDSFQLTANRQSSIVGTNLYASLEVKSKELSAFDVKFAQFGDKLQPNQNSGSKKVKDILKQAKCPVWLRKQIPLIYYKEKLVAVSDVIVDKDYRDKIDVLLTKTKEHE
jgi:tRNA(Ile)-lysidine synthase